MIMIEEWAEISRNDFYLRPLLVMKYFFDSPKRTDEDPLTCFEVGQQFLAHWDHAAARPRQSPSPCGQPRAMMSGP